MNKKIIAMLVIPFLAFTAIGCGMDETTDLNDVKS